MFSFRGLAGASTVDVLGVLVEFQFEFGLPPPFDGLGRTGSFTSFVVVFEWLGLPVPIKGSEVFPFTGTSSFLVVHFGLPVVEFVALPPLTGESFAY